MRPYPSSTSFSERYYAKDITTQETIATFKEIDNANWRLEGNPNSFYD